METVRILFLDDSTEDVKRLVAQLKSDGLDVEFWRATSEAGLRNAFESFGRWDIVVSEYRLRDWSVAGALRVLRTLAPGTPVVVVSSLFAEDAIVTAVQSGVRDYIVKERPEQLGAIIKRELERPPDPNEPVSTIPTIDLSAHLFEQLLEHDRLEAIKTFVSGIGHHLDHSLAIILSQINVLSARLNPQDPLRDTLVPMRAAGERARKLTQELMVFGRAPSSAVQSVAVQQLVVEMQQQLRGTLPRDIDLVLSCQRETPKVAVDATDLKRLIMSVVQNSRDAMPRGGTLAIEIARVELDEAFCQDAAGVQPGSYALIKITDSGVGMDQSTRARCFDPFFTTKSKSGCFGIGLTMVLGAVQKYNGHVSMQTERGLGCCTRVYLPALGPGRRAGRHDSNKATEREARRNISAAIWTPPSQS